MYPPFVKFTDFLHWVAREYSNDDFARPYVYEAVGNKRATAAARALYVNQANSSESNCEIQRSKDDTCIVHKMAKHSTKECKSFRELQFYEKKRLVMKHGRCFSCLGRHLQAECTDREKGDICQGKHCAAMHKSYNRNERTTATAAVTEANVEEVDNSMDRRAMDTRVMHIAHKD